MAAFLLAGRAGAVEDGRLLVWINGDKAYDALQRIGDRFEADLGVPVKVEHPESPTDKFAAAARAGKGPDIFIWAHDRVGEWADSGLLMPVEVDEAVRTNFVAKAWEGFTHRGRVWGYPIAMEVAGLIVNPSLLPETPKTIEGIVAISEGLRKKGIDSILWDYKNPYFTWGLLAGAGAYTFGKDAEGNYDPRDVGVDTPGAIRALEAIDRMIRDGVIPRGVTYSVMDARMNAGQCAMMINGPWSWSNLRQSGIAFEVTTLPGVGDDGVGRPFVGVLGAMIDRNSPNQDLAEEFMLHYVLTLEGLGEMDKDVPLGVPAYLPFYRELSADPHIGGSIRNVEVGELMPNIPEMGRFWSAMQSALSNVTDGQATPAEALANARARILKP